MPILIGESNEYNAAALNVRNNVRGLAPLIYGHNADTEIVFRVQSDGSIWSKYNYETLGGIVANGAADIKGNLWVGRDVMVQGRVFALEFKVSSDKNAKENFSSVNALEILDKLSSMPIQSWTYKEDSSSVRHIGPTAQDFQATFELNSDNKHISSVDIQGIALAAIQGLNEKLIDENAQLNEKLSNLEARLSALESKG